MKAVMLIWLFVIATATKVPSEIDILWKNFKAKFNKNYETSEEISRRPIWEQNMQFIAMHNRKYDLGLHSYTLGLNEYSDMSYEEFSQKMLRSKREITKSNKSEYIFHHISDDNLPETVDWRKKGFVTEIKNQGSCGSCWAFAAVGALEGQLKKKTGQLISLSEQELIDCCNFYGNDICSTGGTSQFAYDCVKHKGGINTEELYPYEEMSRECRFQPKFSVTTCKGYVNIPEGDEEALKHAVATIGPISTSIDASKNFLYYKGGILDDHLCSYHNNHEILIIGYGTEDGIDYWLVKNSFGPEWGLHGYVKMSRNKDNQCNIASTASYPLVE